MDRQRVQALREANLEQQVKDRKLLLITASLLGALIVALLITSLVILLRG